MSDSQSTLDELKTLRDELRVQAHLAGKDLQVWLERQEVRIRDLRHRARRLVDDVKSHGPQVSAAARKLLDEVESILDEARANAGRS